MPETEHSKLKKEIFKELKKNKDGFFFPIVQGPFSHGGISDILGCYKRQFVALEVKPPGKSATRLQELFLRIINKCGGFGKIINSTLEVEGIFDELNKRSEKLFKSRLVDCAGKATK